MISKALFALIFFISIAFSYEVNITLDIKTQPIEKKFSLLFQWGYAISYSEIETWLHTVYQPPKNHLKKLDLTESKNIVAGGVGFSYSPIPRLNISFDLPFGTIKTSTNQESNFVNNTKEEIKFGIGDISFGLSYIAVMEKKYIPGLQITFDLNSSLSKYSTLGNGAWDFSINSRINKQLNRIISIYGNVGYMLTPEIKYIDYGDMFSYGGGIRLILQKKNILSLDMGFKSVHFFKTHIPEEESISGGHCFVPYFNITAIDQTKYVDTSIGIPLGLNLSEGGIGINYGIQVAVDF